MPRRCPDEAQAGANFENTKISVAARCEVTRSFSVVATTVCWSPSTNVRMSLRYGHIGEVAQGEAVKHLKGADSGRLWT